MQCTSGLRHWTFTFSCSLVPTMGEVAVQTIVTWQLGTHHQTPWYALYASLPLAWLCACPWCTHVCFPACRTQSHTQFPVLPNDRPRATLYCKLTRLFAPPPFVFLQASAAAASAVAVAVHAMTSRRGVVTVADHAASLTMRAAAAVVVAAAVAATAAVAAAVCSPSVHMCTHRLAWPQPPSLVYHTSSLLVID